MTAERLRICDESDLVVARRTVRTLADMQGMSEAATEALATAVTEIARNLLVHARGGDLVVETAERDGRRGVVVTARDEGPGIADVEHALRDGFSTAGSLGLGLPSARRLVDELDVRSRIGEGTIVVLRKWVAPE